MVARSASPWSRSVMSAVVAAKWPLVGRWFSFRVFEMKIFSFLKRGWWTNWESQPIGLATWDSMLIIQTGWRIIGMISVAPIGPQISFVAPPITKSLSGFSSYIIIQ